MESPEIAQDRSDADVATGGAVEVVQEKTVGLQMGSEPTSPATNSTINTSITKPPDVSAACKLRLIYSRIV